MRSGIAFVAALLAISVIVSAQATPIARLNPIIELLQQNKPVFGLTLPAMPVRGAAPTKADFVFGNAPEVEKYLAAAPRPAHPVIGRAPRIATDRAGAIDSVNRQLGRGAVGVMFDGVESADEVRADLAAMRSAAKGGEPIYWTSIDTKAGVARVREIAAVKGIGALWAGEQLRQAFITREPNGERVFDVDDWEGAIQQILAACREFKIPCGYPATAADIERRMSQGFSVFLMRWSDLGLQAIDLGRRAGGR